MLEDIVKKGPSSSRLIYYYAKEIFELGGRDDEALIYFKKFVDDPNGFWEDKYQAYYKMATIYMNRGDEAQLKENVFKALFVEDRWAEPYCLLGLYYLNRQLWTKSILWYENALSAAQARPKDLLAYYQPEYYTYLPHLQLCVGYNAIGNIEKAYEHNKMVLFYRPNDPRALNNNRILESALAEKAKPVVGKAPGMNKRLNLGCGNKPLPGYTNVDIFKGPIVDEVFPFDEIPYLDGTIGAIHSEHALEHVPFRRAEQAIKEWFRVLQPGGELLLKIPDLDGCCRGYINSMGDKYNRWWYKATIYGIQESQAGEPAEAQIHFCGFSKEELIEVVGRNSFIVESCEGYDGYRTPSLSLRAIKPSPVKRVGWIAPENWEAAQTRIRVLRVNEWLNKEGHSSKIVGSYEEAISNNFDIVIVGKSFSEQDLTGIKMLKDKGKSVYLDACESLFEFPYFKETVAACDKVICCSEALAEQCRPVNGNVTVIEDAYEIK
jgi:tetratricopeptide (TPR) repeat protein